MEAIKNGLRKNLTPAQLWSGARFFLLLNLGLIIYAVALNFYCAPNHFVFGGTTGLSIVLATCFPALSVSTFMWITNAVLDVLGCVFLGIKTMGWTLYSSFMLSFYSSMCEKMLPVSQPLTDDTLLELCFAVALPAIASGIVFNIGASTGGTEIVAMILHKYIKVEIGRALLLSDIGTVLFAAYLYGPQTGMYCVLGLIGRSTIVDTAIESLNLRKVCTVITSRPEPIRHFVTETLGRTATQQNATGVYTGEPRTMIMVALTRRQAGLLRDFLRREDSDHCQLQQDHRQRIPVHLKTQNARPPWVSTGGRHHHYIWYQSMGARFLHGRRTVHVICVRTCCGCFKTAERKKQILNKYWGREKSRPQNYYKPIILSV